MTKADLIQRLAETTGRTKADAEQALDAVLNVITEALAKGDSVDLRGVGKFRVTERKARQARNPRTGEAVNVASRRVAVFKPSKELAERVNWKDEPGPEAPAAE